MLKYCFKMETLKGLEEVIFDTAEECKKAYNDALNGLTGTNKSTYAISRIYTKRI